MKRIDEIRYRQDLFELFEEPGAAAEIGVAEGNFSWDMLHWIIPVKRNKVKPAVTTLYMVDRWASVPEQKGDASMPTEWHEKNLNTVKERLKSIRGRAVILRGDSVAQADKVEDESLTLINIDGDHSEAGCFRDLRAWVPKVKPGGYVVLHDYLNKNYGVYQAVQNFCAGNFKVYVIAEDNDENASAIFQVT